MYDNYRGPRNTPNMEDIKDIVKGFSEKEVLAFVPETKALSKTQRRLFDKKVALLKKFDCPLDWVYRKLSKEEVLKQRAEKGHPRQRPW